MQIDGVHPRRKDERAYEREMREQYVRPYLDSVAAALREARPNSTEAWLSVVASATAIFERDMAVRFPREVVERWVKKVNAYHADRFVRTFRRAARVDITPWLDEERIRLHLLDVVERNIDLITTIPERFKDGLAEKIARAEREAPMDLAIRERIFRQEGRLAGYNLRRVTRDQTNKLNGELSRIRQTDAGITEYKWSTSQDDRVRPTHVEKNQRVFSWGHAPPDTGHPGNDIQCRCVAIPHVTLESLQQRFGA